MSRTEITVTAPKEFCRWCDAGLVQDLRTGNYFMSAKMGCVNCRGTGDHNYNYSDVTVMARYVVAVIED